MTLRDEVTELLRGLIRLDTVNPPGNETRAAEYLAAYLARNGIESELVGKVPERMNLVARLPGGGGPSLALICHTDTVLADPADCEKQCAKGDAQSCNLFGVLIMGGRLGPGDVHQSRPPRAPSSATPPSVPP